MSAVDRGPGLPDPSLVVPPMMPIPAGDYLIGYDAGRPDERPAHVVRLRAFLLAAIPVTNQAYERYLVATGAEAPRFWSDAAYNQPTQPVVGVTWFEAAAYCEWLSMKSGRRFRLPTEAEREAAMRGGREATAYPWGDELNPDWLFERHSLGMGLHGADVVGAEPANGFGIHDLGSNIHEWCSDWYDARYYTYSPADNPQGPPAGVRKSSRGGAWRHAIRVCRNAARSAIPPEFQYSDYGFRLAADP